MDYRMRSGLPAAIILSGVLAVVVGAAAASASDDHYESFQVGERAAGMGGAATALAGEATGAFYNPAGLADCASSSLGLTLSAYQLDIRSYDDQLSLGEAQRPVEISGFSGLPAGLGYVRAFGSPRWRQAIGLFVVSPASEINSGQVSLSGVSTPDIRDFSGVTSYRVTDRTIWFGAGYAIHLHPRLSIGGNILYLLRHSQLLNAGLMEGHTSRGAVGMGSVQRYELLHGSMRFDLGLKLRLTESLRLGLALRTPNIRLHSDGTAYVAVVGDSASMVPDADVEVASESPWAVSFGAAWEVPGHFAVALDVRYHAAIGPYRTGTVVLPDGQLFGGMTVERTHIANLAIGGEYYVSPSWVVRGGLFTDLSAQPELVPIATQSGVERVNLFGFATSAGWISEKTTLTLTFTYAGGVGDVVGRVNGGTPEEAFVVSRAVRHQLGLLLGGAYAW